MEGALLAAELKTDSQSNLSVSQFYHLVTAKNSHYICPGDCATPRRNQAPE